MSRAEAASRTSSLTSIPLAPSAVMKSSVVEQSLTSAATIEAPAAARLRANCCPLPRAAPVMITTLERISITAAANRAPPGSNNQLGTRIDQVHLIEVGNEPHRFPRLPSGGGIDPAADLDTVDNEVHHRLHTHRLDDIEACLERGGGWRHLSAPFDNMLGA